MMYYEPWTEKGMQAAIKRLHFLANITKPCTIEGYSKTRSSKQNRALHKFFKQVSDLLNNAGATMEGVSGMEIPYTETIIKEVWWRPIQLLMFDIKSTTKINTNQINQIFDVISLQLETKIGEHVEFPSIETLMKKD